MRDPEKWFESTRNTIYELSKITAGSRLSRAVFSFVGFFGPGVFRIGRMGKEIIWDGTFHGRLENKTHAIKVFEGHNREVLRRVPEDRLLVYEVGQGWEPLCEFLGAGAPDKPFPRLNDTAEMQQRIQGVRALSIAVPTALALLAFGAFALLRRDA